MGGKIGGIRHENPDPEKDIVETPMWLVERMVEIANIQKGECVIDPCCGDNRILEYAKPSYGMGFEIRNIKTQEDMPSIHTQYGIDFFSQEKFILDESCDLAIMNPPFSDCGVFRFTTHLINHWLKEDWRIITVVPLYILQQNMTRRAFMEKHLYDVYVLDVDSFPGRTVNGFICEFRANITGKSKYLVENKQIELVE